MSRYFVISALSLAVAGSLSTHVATAQDSKLVLEEVIVTSQKREQSLQDVPISVSAFGMEKLESMGIDELEDIGAKVPNLFLNSFNNDASTVRLFVRGIGQNDVQLTQDPSVALYIDGIYVGSSIGSGLETVELERIEVLRGPQGTLYGRNSTGGAVNMITQRPDLEQFGFKQSFSAGNYGLFKSKTSVNMPFGDSSALKLSYLVSDRDGLTENEGEGEDWAVEERQGLRLDLRSRLSDTLMLDYAYDDSDIDDTSRLEMIHDAVNPAGLAVFSTEPAPGRPDRATPTRPVGPSNVEVSGHTLTMNWDYSDDLSIRAIGGYREVESLVDHDGTPTVGIIAGNPASSSLRETEFEQLTFELQFIGSAMDNRLEYVGGIYYYEDESEQTSLAAGSVLGPRSPLDYTLSENDSLAVYGEFTFSPEALESWHFTLGLRYSDDQRQAFRVNENSPTFAAIGGFTEANCFDPYFQGAGCPPTAGATVEGAAYKKDFQNFNPSLTVAYDLSDDVNLYGKVITGYKSGGTSQRSANPIAFGEGFEEEDVVSYELGVKGKFVEGRMAFNAALFRMDLDGWQASVQTGSTAGDRDFTPIDGTEIQGLEADMTFLISENLEMSLGYGYLDTKMGLDRVETLLSTGAVQITEVVPEISYAPENSYTLAFDYSTETAMGDLDIHLGYAYQDEAVTSLNQFDNLPTDSRGLLDINATFSGIELGGGELRVSLWGRNVTDEEYIIVNTGSLRELFPGGLLGLSPWTTWGDPATYGVTVNWDY